jgi:hypothetical protein
MNPGMTNRVLRADRMFAGSGGDVCRSTGEPEGTRRRGAARRPGAGGFARVKVASETATRLRVTVVPARRLPDTSADNERALVPTLQLSTGFRQSTGGR